MCRNPFLPDLRSASQVMHRSTPNLTSYQANSASPSSVFASSLALSQFRFRCPLSHPPLALPPEIQQFLVTLTYIHIYCRAILLSSIIVVQLSEVLEPRSVHPFNSIVSESRLDTGARGYSGPYTPVVGLDCQATKVVLADHSRSRPTSLRLLHCQASP